MFWGELFVIKLISIESGGVIFESEGGVSKSWKKISDVEEFIKDSDIISIEVVDALYVILSSLLVKWLRQLRHFNQPNVTSFFAHGIRFLSIWIFLRSQ